MEALLLLDDNDLITLAIPLGPRRKLLRAIDEYKQRVQQQRKEIFSSKL